MSRLFVLPLVGCLISVTGCGSDPGPVGQVVEVVEASGTLTYKGKPLEGFRLTFMPVNGDRPATGVTDASGKFVLGTNAVGDGCVAGQNKVAVVWQGPETMDDGMGTPIDDPRKLPKAPVKIPAKYANPETSGLLLDVSADGTADLKIDLQ